MPAFSKQWSCQTFHDGITHVENASLDDLDEDALMKELEVGGLLAAMIHVKYLPLHAYPEGFGRSPL